MEAWCQKELSRLLNFTVEEELVSYLLSMHTAKDVEDYLSELLGADHPGGLVFQKEFISRWHPPQRVPSPLTPQEGKILEELTRPPQEDMVLFRGDGSRGTVSKTSKKTNTAPPPGFTDLKTTPTPTTTLSWNKGVSSNPPSVPPPGLKQPSSLQLGRLPHSSKKQKFVPLMSREGQSRVTMHVPGRHACQCLAQKHNLINNCVQCGRIVCTQEGAGPCLFCGSLIFPPDDEKMLAKDSKKAQKIKEKLIKQYNLHEGERAFEHFKAVHYSQGLERAVEHRNKLLNFDETSAQRTHVLDDERDFFAVDATSWSSPEEKAALQQREKELRDKKYGSRRNKAFTLDITGKKVVEDSSEIDMYDEANVADLKENLKKKSERERQTLTDISNPSIPIQRPKFRFGDRDKERKGGVVGCVGGGERVPLITRLQDRELQEMRDEGKCLSMHQPWATLLVEGIKRVEGRSWYTTHRGRLWIAAAVKEPSQTDIEQQHHFYRTLYGVDIMFPCEYPVGCLLGCVDMTDCLSQEQYRDKYPNGESESPYVFICQNPRQLVVKFPIKGDHKIWRLPKDVHNSAKTALNSSVHHQ